MAKKHAKKVAKKVAKVKTPTKRAYTKRNPRLTEANARLAAERKAIHSDEENIKQAVCDRDINVSGQDYKTGWSEGERIGRNRAISEDPIASRIRHLEGLEASLAHLGERKLMNEAEAAGIAASFDQVRANMERIKRELRGLMPDIEASYPINPNCP